MEWFLALVALTAMEIVLGIDNIVFISVQTDRLPEHQRSLGRRLGLGGALLTRILLLLALRWVMKADAPLFDLANVGLPADWFDEEVMEISIKDLILLGGGLFLIVESVREIHKKLEGQVETHRIEENASLGGVLFRIAMLDIIFSLDSVITAVGMAREIWVMIVAVMFAVGVMLVFADSIGRFVSRHPTLKMLALSFLILIGVMLVAEGIGTHINKGYIYFAMAFALIVEFLNLRVRTRRAAVTHG